jgi:predicted transcriptional regulator
MAKSKRIAVSIDADTHARLIDLAKKEDRSISWYVERLILAHLKSLAKPSKTSTR